MLSSLPWLYTCVIFQVIFLVTELLDTTSFTDYIIKIPLNQISLKVYQYIVHSATDACYINGKKNIYVHVCLFQRKADVTFLVLYKSFFFCKKITHLTIYADNSFMLRFPKWGNTCFCVQTWCCQDVRVY